MFLGEKKKQKTILIPRKRDIAFILWFISCCSILWQWWHCLYTSRSSSFSDCQGLWREYFISEICFPLGFHHQNNSSDQQPIRFLFFFLKLWKGIVKNLDRQETYTELKFIVVHIRALCSPSSSIFLTGVWAVRIFQAKLFESLKPQSGQMVWLQSSFWDLAVPIHTSLWHNTI